MADINGRALERGRSAGEVRSMALARIITAPTAIEAREKYDGLQRIGTPEDVAAQIQNHAATSGLDGYMINPLVSPGSLGDFAELVVPELAKRGLYDTEPKTGTMRSRLRADGEDLMARTTYRAGFRQG